MKLTISLLVLRCRDLEATRGFYEQLGIAFVEERHGAGVRHYACENDGFVLELYPATDEFPPDKVRIGFSTPLLADLSGNVRHSPEMKVLKQPHVRSDRLVLVLEDPDGRKVEVSQSLHR